MNRPAVTPARSLAAEQLSQTFTGSASERVKRARLVATHLERILERIDSGQLEATPTEVARLEGADLALRAISRTRLES
ncbi:hypothetical protein [Williamsia sp. 1135]|uniref:hypothetical protein n=1 Tax=Williamsia sp. 1135 TaxID=1889262 RepID=UPI000A10FC89|nr:hypothetical protein [Williamsia sp. 1135]ORM25196.1 hypothetical protein BFL43_26115 [Williamsia sp. 1135]